MTDSINGLKPATAVQDSSKSGLIGKPAKTDLSKRAESSSSWFPEWLKLLSYGLLAFLLLVVYYYVKWRNSRLDSISSQKTESSKSKPARKTAKTAKETANSNQKALSAYKKQGSILDKVIKDDPSAKIEKKSVEKTEKLIGQDNSSTQMDKHSKNELEALLSTLRTEASGQPSTTAEPPKISQSVKPETPRKAASAKLEMAMHLAGEQHKIKEEGISKLKNNKESLASDDLADFAKKLGIEKGSVETKQTLDNYSTDKTKLAGLAEKFKAK